MADERKRDYSFELLGALILFLLLALLCYFRVICPLPSCPEGMIQCNNCPGNCCLPDGSCPCPEGSVPCSTFCPSTLNCPSGCCNVDTCACIATPQCPPNTVWSESRGCCVFINGPNTGKCADICSTDPRRISCRLRGVDSCDSNNCCPLGSLGWDEDQKCCLDSSGKCFLSCLIDSSRTGCPTPGIGGCDATGCCPKDTNWNEQMQCCIYENGFCYGDPCANINCPSDKICINGECRDRINLCEGVVCIEGEVCDPLSGNCIDSCTAISCPIGQICINGKCEVDRCKDVICPSGQICLNGKCLDSCDGVVCSEWQECDPTTKRCIDKKCLSDLVCKECKEVVLQSGSVKICGGIKGSKECKDDSDCSDVKCLQSGLCGYAQDGSQGETTPINSNLINCGYKPPFTPCPQDIICSGYCAEGIKCTDPRLPEDKCKKIGERCSNSTECCCGISCQIFEGEGVCCPGGIWKCGYNLD